MKPLLAVAALVLTALSGCADAADPAAASNTSAPATTAPVPTVSVETGSIAGTIVDDEARPISGADVLLTPGDLQARTDAAGAFTFNEIVAGSYSLLAQRVGYEAVGKKVEAIAGEVITVGFTMKSLVGDEGYTQTILKVAMFHYGARVVNFWLTTVNHSAINQFSCDPCVFVVFPDPKPKHALTETFWNSPTSVPMTNSDSYIFYRAVWESSAYLVGGDNVLSNQFENREKFEWSEAATKAVAASGKALLIAHPSYYGSIEHKVEIHTSFAYNAPFPEDFIALPPA